MKQFLFRSLTMVALILGSLIEGDAKTLVPFYKTSNQSWEARYYSAPIDGTGAPEDWFSKDFNDSSWETIESPLFLSNGKWQANYYSYWVRCHFTMDELKESSTYSFFVQHDDGCVAYLNGVNIYEYDGVISDYTSITISDEAKAALVKGENVLCVFVSDTGGGDAFMDFGLYEYENELTDIVTNSDVTITFTNDETHPWSTEGGTAVIRGNNQSNYYAASWLTMSFSLEEETIMSFEWASYNYDYHPGLELYLDGVYNSKTTNSSYTLKRLVLEPGEHVIAFRDSVSYYNHTYNWSGIRNVQLKTIVPPDYSPVLAYSDIDNVTFTNSNWLCPWDIEDNVAVVRGKTDCPYSTSWLTMSYQSDKRTEFSFDWAMYNYSYHESLQVYVDGIYQGYTTNSSYTSQRFYLDAGEHVIAFRDSVRNYNYTENWSAIKNVKIKEILPLETAVLSDNSMPLTFTNNSATPWIIEDGYIEHQNLGVRNSASSFSTTFTIDKTSKLQFTYKVANYNYSDSYNYEDSHNLFVTINGIQISKSWNNINDTYWCVALEPGDYTVVWKDTVYNRYSYNYYTQIKNIELSNNWITCELATAGTLGVEALYQVNVLNDVEMLKVVGPMNSSDWTDIKNMTNLKALDLSEAVLTEIPDYAFDGKGWINSVILPEGIKSIGEYAFRGTNIRRVNIPSTVINIAQYAFVSTPLQEVTFATNSQIETIGDRAFSACSVLQKVDFGDNNSLISVGRGAFFNCSSLQTVQLPSTVNEVWYGAFQGCSSLKSIAFSDAMTVIRDYVCANCSALEEVHMPVALTAIHTRSFMGTSSLKQIDIPSTVNEIRSYSFYQSGIESVALPVTMQYLYRYAFSNCKSLKYVELPSYLERGTSLGYYDYYYSADGSSCYYDNCYYGYRYNFVDCTALETVVMRSAAPPTIDEDPFSGASTKSAITLKVPSFAVVNYKLDTYWYQFGSIVEGDDVDYWRIANPLSLTNNRRMQGKPDIDLYYGGQFTVGGNAPMEIGQFNYYVSESNPGRLLNTCEAMTADSINTYFSVNSETWYFFTPIYDVDLTKVSVSNNASYVFRYYDGDSRATNGTGNSWRNVDNGKLTAGQGYIFRCNANAVVTMPCEAVNHLKVFNTSDVTQQLNAYEAAASANKSWNYVGNPYPCYYDIYYMDFTAPITVWTGSTYKAYSIVDDNYALRPMQSFFVQKPDAVDHIVFHKEGRQLTADINHGAAVTEFRAPAQNNRHFFDLQLLSDEMVDETRIVVNNEASLGYEIECDASKFMSVESAVPQIFTLDADNNGYAINERPLADAKARLAYYAGQTGYYTISATRADGEIYLYDGKTNKTINLAEQDYTFHSNATENANTSRFILTFSVNDATGIETVEDSKTESNDVYDLQGRKVQKASKGVFIQNGRKVILK